MNRKVSRFEVAFLCLSLALGAASGHYAQPFVHDNGEAISLLATVFSILAGLLVGIITLLSDASVIPGVGWRAAALARPVLKRRLARHRILFLVYLATLVLLLLSVLIPDNFVRTLIWIERAYVFLGTIGFAYSFRLPWSLARIQEERVDAVIEERRRAVGLEHGVGDPPGAEGR